MQFNLLNNSNNLLSFFFCSSVSSIHVNLTHFCIMRHKKIKKKLFYKSKTSCEEEINHSLLPLFSTTIHPLLLIQEMKQSFCQIPLTSQKNTMKEELRKNHSHVALHFTLSLLNSFNF